MRVLARRGGLSLRETSHRATSLRATGLRRSSQGALSGRFVVAPRRQVARLITPVVRTAKTVVSGKPGASRPSDAVVVSRVDQGETPSLHVKRAAERVAAARRRRVLMTLAVLTVLTGVIAVIGLVPRWAIVLPVLLIIGFLVAARRSVRRARQTNVMQPAAPEASNGVRRCATRVDASHGAVRVRASAMSPGVGTPAIAEHVEQGDPDEPTVALSVGDVAQPDAAVVAVQTSRAGSLWDPLPVTLPTYVDKPAAHRTIRTIDISAPATWSSGHSAAASATAAEADHAGDVVAPTDAKPDPPEEARRVVNG